MNKKNKQPNQVNKYLEKLQFKPKFLDSAPGRYLKNIRLAVILILAIVAFGIFSFLTIPKTLNPQVKIPFIIVNTTLPGASPNEIESFVTIPLENEIKNLQGVTTYQSASRDSVSIITVEFTSETKTSEARNRVQTAVDKVTNLPNDASTPRVQALDFENFPVITFALTKKTAVEDTASLMRLATKFDDYLEGIKAVDRVEISGLDNREIHILIQPEKITEKRINPFTLSEKIKNKLQAYPAGKVKTNNSSFSLTIDQPITTLDQLRKMEISFAGQNYQLSELAQISEQTAHDQQESFYLDSRSNLKRTVVFEIYKTTSAELDETGKNVRESIIDFMNDYQENYETKMISDYSAEIDQQFSDLWSNFGQTLALVFASMLLLYGIKQALIAALAIPLALLIVFIAMRLWDITLSFVSIFSILIALGLFVDNAVVIIEAYTSYYRSGKFSPLETAILVWRDFFVELFSINLLTVWAFLPLLISTGIIGEFIFPIPIIVSVAMIGSAGVAMLFTLPSIMVVSDFNIPNRVAVLLKLLLVVVVVGSAVLIIPKTFLFVPTLTVFLVLIYLIYTNWLTIYKKIKSLVCKRCWYKDVALFFKRAFNKGFISLDKLSLYYRKTIKHLLSSKPARIKVLIIIISFTLFSYLLVPLGLVKNEFFPKSDQDQLYIQLELPPGTNQQTTTAEVKELMPQLKDYQNIQFAVGEVGKTVDTGFSISTPGPNNARITLALKEADQRKITSMTLAQQLRDQFKNYTTGKLQIVEESSGPPAGADLQINITGEELEKIEGYASQVEEYLAQLEGTTNINRSIKKGTSKLSFIPNKQKLLQYGIDEAQIGFWMRTLVTGFNFNQLEVDNKEYDLILKMTDQTPSPETISSLQVPTNRGYVPLEELGTIRMKPSPTLITRENGQRTISVSASALPGYKPPELNQKMETFVKNNVQFDQGYNWNTGGVNEENQKSVQSILQAMVISMLLILGTMVIQLGSFRNALIVILVIPLAASGVFTFFALLGIPLSFPALIGILALFGIVIANSLMIVDKVKQNRKVGMSIKEAIVDASASRLEPILLTTASQIIGLIPITLSDPLWRGMGGAIIAGMSFSGTILLFFIPIVYFYFFPQED
jgi:HAE1 family hydrophobic/amphiphilic exporter-1